MSKNTLFFLCFIMFLSMTGYGVVLPALPYLAEKLQLSSFQMGSLITAWALAQFISVPIWGRLSDKVGRKPIILFGLAGFGVAFISLIFASSYLELLTIRIIGAILSSGLQPAAMAFVVDSFEKKERNIAISKMGAANGLGFLCGPAVGSAFSPFGIMAPFIVSGLLSLIVIPFTWYYLKEPSKKSSINNQSGTFIESVNFLFHKNYRSLFFITFGMALAASSLFSMLGYFMIDRFDANPFETGAAFSIQSGAAVFIQLFIMGYIFKKFLEKSIITYGLLLQLIGFACIGFAQHLFILFIGCIILGIGGALSRPTIMTMLSRQNSLGQGTVMGLQQAMDSFGRTIGPLLAGVLFSISSSAPFIAALFVCFILMVGFIFTETNTETDYEQKVLSK